MDRDTLRDFQRLETLLQGGLPLDAVLTPAAADTQADAPADPPVVEVVIEGEVVEPFSDAPAQPSPEALHQRLSEVVPEEAETDRLVRERLEEIGRRTMPTAQDVFAQAQAGVQGERSRAVAQQLGEQSLVYESASRQALIDALLDRDALIIQLGRQVADGKLGGAMLREFVRGILTAHDVGDKQQVQKLLEGLGADKADARMLRLKGTTL